MKKLTEAEVWEFFDSKPGWAALTTQGPDGYPHSVAIGYFRLGSTIYCGCRPDTQKTRNIQRNPKVSLLLESQRSQPPPLRGVMFQGDARVIVEPAELLAVKRQLAVQKGESEPTEVGPGVAYIAIQVARIRSWSR